MHFNFLISEILSSKPLFQINCIKTKKFVNRLLKIYINNQAYQHKFIYQFELNKNTFKKIAGITFVGEQKLFSFFILCILVGKFDN